MVAAFYPIFGWLIHRLTTFTKWKDGVDTQLELQRRYNKKMNKSQKQLTRLINKHIEHHPKEEQRAP